MKPAKKPHSSMDKKKETNTPAVPKKVANWNETYFCMRSWRERPIDKDRVLDYGQDFYSWAYDLAYNQKDPLPGSLTKWRTLRGIPKGTFDDWRKKYPELDAYVAEGLNLLGIIREEGLLTKRFSEKACIYSLPQYLPEWKEHDNYQDGRRVILEKKEDGSFIVKMVDFTTKSE